MLHRKLLEVLVRLTPSEHKQLRLFLASPYLTQGTNQEQVLVFYDLIMAYQADETHPALQKEAVFKTLFPEKIYLAKEKGPLDSLSSDLYKLTRKFLFQVQLDRDSESASSYIPLLQFYRKNGLEERFWQTAAIFRRLQDQNKTRGKKFFLDQLNFEEEISNFQGTFNTHEDDANLVAVQQNIDRLFAILKLEYACALNHRQKTTQISIHQSERLTKAILDIIDEEDYIKTPLSLIYRKILSILVAGPSAESLNELLLQLESEKNYIPAENYRNLLAYYRSFWGRQYLNAGTEYYRQNLFNIYSSHLFEGYLYIDDKLTPLALRVLTNIGLKVGQFPWVKKLLDDHPPERICGTKYPVEAHSLNVAEYHFHKKEYAEAEAKLTYRAFENPNFSIMADLLLIKIYYETNSELLESRMKALEQKVRRSKISTETKAGYYNFLKKLDKVVKYGWQKSTPKLAKLVEEIKTTPGVIDREWLLSKLS